jgi:hypothetical protein
VTIRAQRKPENEVQRLRGSAVRFATVLQRAGSLDRKTTPYNCICYRQPSSGTCESSLTRFAS